MRAALCLLDDVMNFQVPGGSAARRDATIVVAREYLLAEPWRHRGGGSLGRGCIERADVLGITRCALEHLRGDVDLAPGAVLRDAPAVLTLLIGDLMHRAIGTGAWDDDRAADRLDEVSIAQLAAAFFGDDHARLPPQRIDLRRQLEAHHARTQVGIGRVLRPIARAMVGDQTLDLITDE